MGGLFSAAKAAGLPDPLRKVDLSKATDHFADAMNIPADLLFTDEEVAEHDKARDQAQQQAQVPGQAAAAVDAAKTLSQTNTGPGNALSALMGGQGGGPSPQ